MSNKKETLKTFDEWSSKGYQILKGSKAKWVNNKPMFSRDQVVKSTFKSRNRIKKTSYDWTSGLDHDDTIEYGILENH